MDTIRTVLKQEKPVFLPGSAGGVLIVDDDPVLLEMLGEVVRRHGLAAFSAASLPAARRVLAESDVRAAIIDLHLGPEDGLSLLEDPDCENLRDTALILLTGLDRDVLSLANDAARRLGFHVLGALSKPFRRWQLSELLERIGSVAARADDELDAGQLLREEFGQAVAAGGIQPYFQPQYCLQTGDLVGYEALARLRLAGVKQVIEPNRFAGFLDKPPFAWDVFATMSRQAIGALGAQRAVPSQVRVSINVPASVFGDLRMRDQLLTLCSEFAVSPSRIVLELTETDYGPFDPAQMIGMARLRIAGFGLSLDDFGSGASNLERLARLPLTEVKVDAQFLRGSVDGDARLGVLLRDIATLCRHRGLLAVIEGVEDGHMLEVARRLHFDVGQGYLLGRPQAAREAFRLPRGIRL